MVATLGEVNAMAAGVASVNVHVLGLTLALPLVQDTVKNMVSVAAGPDGAAAGVTSIVSTPEAYKKEGMV